MNRYRRELGDRLLALKLAAGGRVHQYPEVQALRRFLSAFAVDCSSTSAPIVANMRRCCARMWAMKG